MPEYVILPTAFTSPVFCAQIWRGHVGRFEMAQAALYQTTDLLVWLAVALKLTSHSDRDALVAVMHELAGLVAKAMRREGPATVAALLNLRSSLAALCNMLLGVSHVLEGHTGDAAPLDVEEDDGFMDLRSDRLTDNAYARASSHASAGADRVTSGRATSAAEPSFSEGGAMSGGSFKLPSGGSFKLPDGTSFKLPPAKSFKLPQDADVNTVSHSATVVSAALHLRTSTLAAPEPKSPDSR